MTGANNRNKEEEEGKLGENFVEQVSFELRFEESGSMKKMKKRGENILRPVYSKVLSRYTEGLTIVMAGR